MTVTLWRGRWCRRATTTLASLASLPSRSAPLRTTLAGSSGFPTGPARRAPFWSALSLTPGTACTLALGAQPTLARASTKRSARTLSISARASLTLPGIRRGGLGTGNDCRCGHSRGNKDRNRRNLAGDRGRCHRGNTRCCRCGHAGRCGCGNTGRCGCLNRRCSRRGRTATLSTGTAPGPTRPLRHDGHRLGHQRRARNRRRTRCTLSHHRHTGAWSQVSKRNGLGPRDRGLSRHRNGDFQVLTRSDIHRLAINASDRSRGYAATRSSLTSKPSGLSGASRLRGTRSSCMRTPLRLNSGTW